MSKLPERFALVGNPNCGKTALFNQLTGARQKVANYAGVTVERKEGRLTLPSGRNVTLLDLPGAYSLHAASPDEAVTRRVCLGEQPGEPLPDVLLCVVDATNLRLHLRFALEVMQLGRPMVLVLNMMDDAKRRGINIDRETLSRRLGVPVIESIALRKAGVQQLLQQMEQPQPAAPSISDIKDLHAEVNSLLDATVQMPTATDKRDDALDRVLLHPIFGLLILAVSMFLVFQAVFAWADPFIGMIEEGIGALGALTVANLPEGILSSFINDGLFAGVGSVLVFLPQILILFFFILVMEESGYLPRAAFLLDRMMFKAGLSGRAFIPLLSSFACAVPGIMATRSIADPRDRLITIMVAPLMTCSARLPVYTLLIAAFLPSQTVWGIFNLQGLVLFGLYFGGIFSALAIAWFTKLFERDRSDHPLLMELPSYRIPAWRSVAQGLYERGMIFLKRVGGIIFALTVLLWVLLTFPGAPENATLPAIDYSFAGIIGHWMEPIFAPIGFNWQICIALIPSMAAREVVVASLGTIYALSGNEDFIASQLGDLIANQWSLATGMSLLVWFIYAPHCLSTLATVRRETGSWAQVGVMTGYMFGLAYVASLIAYHATLALT